MKNSINIINNFLFEKIYLHLLPSTRRKSILELRGSFKTLLLKGNNDETILENTWKVCANRLIELGLYKDPQKFLNWDVIKSTMFVSGSNYIDKELSFLMNSPDWGVRWHNAIIESPIGSPERYPQFPASSENLIHHAYHLAKFEEKTNIKINDFDFVFEFGGGYGSMGRLFNNLGFKGKYVIYDLPCYSALQIYYLKSIGLPVYENDSHEIKSGVLCFSDFQKLNESLELNNLSNSLFIGTWSISETPNETRNIVLPLAMKCNYLLITYQYKFGEINNQSFIREFTLQNSNFDWISWPINHIPGNNYLIGKPATKS